MGGDVAVTLRMPSGKEHRMIQWTNCMPYWLSVMFSEEDVEEFFTPLVEFWLKKVKEDKRREYRCIPDSCLFPVGYGLILCDFQTKTILSANNYLKVGYVTSSLDNKTVPILPLIEQKKFHWFELSWTDLTHEEVITDLGRGRKRRGKFRAYQVITLEEYLTSFGSYDDFLDYLYSLRPNMRDESNTKEEFFLKLKFDTRPFNVIEYRLNRFDALRMRDKIKELGFELTPREKEVWHMYFDDALRITWNQDDVNMFHQSVELAHTKLKKLFSTRWGKIYLQRFPWSRRRLGAEVINRIQCKEQILYSDKKDALDRLNESFNDFLTGIRA